LALSIEQNYSTKVDVGAATQPDSMQWNPCMMSVFSYGSTTGFCAIQRWWFSVVVASLGTSTKLLYARPG